MIIDLTTTYVDILHKKIHVGEVQFDPEVVGTFMKWQSRV